MSQDPSQTNDTTRVALADTERPPEYAERAQNPNCLICTGKLRYLAPRPGELQTLSTTEEFTLAPGTKPGWQLEIVFHGLQEVTPVWKMELVLFGREEVCWRTKPGGVLPHEGEWFQNAPGPINLRSCEGTGSDPVWHDACRTFRTVFGSIPRQRHRNERVAVEPTIKVGSLLVIGETDRMKTTIQLPIAHIAQRYVREE